MRKKGNNGVVGSLFFIGPAYLLSGLIICLMVPAILEDDENEKFLWFVSLF